MTDFLQDEVRSGFYIPTAIKQAWAVQLKILSEVDRICSKYDIKYFADWGTYLGAVRHGGFIPWDDDLDICMLREDYDRFRQVAASELPEGYAIHNFATKENHWLFLARVVNTNNICFDKKHLDENYNFPYIATVDIFVLDYLYADADEEKKRCDEVKRIIATADGIVKGTYSGAVADKLLSELETGYGLTRGSLSGGHTVTSDGSTENRRQVGIALYSLAEQQMGRTPKDKSKDIGQIFPWILKGGKGLPKEYYEEAVRLPFEFTTIPVPAYYHMGLQGRYGDYMRICKIWGGHDYPYFERQRANLQAVADFKLPEFTFSTDMLRENQPDIDKSGSLKVMAGECLAELEAKVNVITDSDNIDYDNVLNEIATCQQLAVDLGTLVEEVKGERREGTVKVVGSLETFCEALYGLYMYLQDAGTSQDFDKFDYMRDSFTAVREAVERYIIKRREALFVTAGAGRLQAFSHIYDILNADEDTDVYVVDVPVMRKDVSGQIMPESDSTDSDNLAILSAVSDNLVDFKSYIPDIHMPDVIFINDMYDRENPCLTVPEMYYAENLQRYTYRLVFVPPFTVNEFTRADTTDWYNMKHYVTAPGVVRADEVLVQSENLRQNYVEKLTEFAGEDTRHIWEQKVAVLSERYGRSDDNYDKTKDESHKKRKKMLYCIGLNEIFEHREDILEKVQGRLNIIEQNADKLDTVVCIYPPDESAWLSAAPDEAGKLFAMIKKHNAGLSLGGALPELYYDADYDAYYGSPNRYAHYFNVEGRPVMLCDMKIGG